MDKQLTLGSLFSGSGSFELSGMLAGIKPVWLSEVAPFPLRVTEKRLPEVKQYGDINKLNGVELPPVDIITFGSPCQDMSIAGKRTGLDGERSGLFHQAIRIIKEMRCATNGKSSRYIVWENVMGCLSSNKGEDFRTVLEEICKVKGGQIDVPQPEKWYNAGEILGDDFSVAWRVFDAQYWGVPQRRKRIYLVADFNSTSAGKILFESESVSGYSAQSFCAWKDAAESAGRGSDGAVTTIVLNDQGGQRMDVTDDFTATLRAEAHHPPLVMESAGFCTEHSAKARGIGFEEEKAPTLRAGVVPAALCFENHGQDTRYRELDGIAPTVSATYGTGSNNQPFVVSQAYGICSKESNSMKSDNPDSGFYEAETSRTIDTSSQSPCKNQGGMAIVETYDVRLTSDGTKNSRANVYQTDTARTLDTGGNSPDANQGGVVVVSIQGSMIGRQDKNGPKGSGIGEDVSFTLNCTDKHAVAYGIDRAAFNQGANAQYNFSIDEEVQPTLTARGPGAVAEEVYSTSKNSHHTTAEKELANTLVASDYKDPPTVNERVERKYIVRRLTPKECARLQGLPSWYCDGLGTENPAEEEVDKWEKIWTEWNTLNGKKPKSRKQVIKWLKQPYSDSEAYKMYGNGIAVPCGYFVLASIKHYTQNKP